MKRENPAAPGKPVRLAASASLTVCGLCLMAACASIYFSPGGEFTRETVIDWLMKLRFVLLATAVLCAAACFFPAGVSAPGRCPAYMTLARLRRTRQIQSLSEEARAEFASLDARRRLRRCICLALTVLGGAVFLAYAVQADSFHQSEINRSMLRAMPVLLVCAGVPMGCGLWASLRAEKAMERQIALLRTAAKLPAHSIARNRRTAVTKVVFVLALAALVYGYLSGGAVDVLTKAVNICTECVGLG